IIMLLFLFGRSLLLIGGFYNQYMTKRKNDHRLNNAIKELDISLIDQLKELLPDKDNSLFIHYLRDLLSNKPSEEYSDFLLSNFENAANKDMALSKILAK